MYALNLRSNSWKYFVLSMFTLFFLIFFVIWSVDYAAKQDCLQRNCHGFGVGKLFDDVCVCVEP